MTTNQEDHRWIPNEGDGCRQLALVASRVVGGDFISVRQQTQSSDGPVSNLET